MGPQTIDVPPLDRRAEVGTVHDDTRTVDLVFSTGSDVPRYDWMSGEKYIERLSMDPKAIRLGRLNSGAPLLNTHSAYELEDVIGVVEPNTAKIAGKVATATVRFSKRDDVEPYYQDVKDGIIRNVSVGYRIHKFEETAASAGAAAVRLATDWEPYEISLVPMGADPGAGTRGAKPSDTNPCVVVRSHSIVIADADRNRRARLAHARH